ncbi:uncharacterized protein N7459_000522 [Penicillium hispanicum]|uniref:uncharacterized protein n=1 Tax=Penicillium hispanicum TaxID=1080232 RepID=UPI0025406DF8|nr:uncharacterized protein N7459_000522 [Penicillium hispanicum]KAJ5594314.1 hypothetical protein N7459_000522 [Penicillium hispanicum]
MEGEAGTAALLRSDQHLGEGEEKTSSTHSQNPDDDVWRWNGGFPSDHSATLDGHRAPTSFPGQPTTALELGTDRPVTSQRGHGHRIAVFGSITGVFALWRNLAILHQILRRRGLPATYFPPLPPLPPQGGAARSTRRLA